MIGRRKAFLLLDTQEVIQFPSRKYRSITGKIKLFRFDGILMYRRHQNQRWLCSLDFIKKLPQASRHLTVHLSGSC